MKVKSGIDLGSRAVKIVSLDEKGVKDFWVFDTVSFYKEFGKYTRGRFEVNLKKLGIKSKNIISTGYGRNSCSVEKKITEIIAHAKGAIYQTKRKNFTLLDIGGQDNKVVLVKHGVVSDFKINDRCAAGSGRYLENMCAVLNIGIEQLAKCYKNPVDLNSTCAVFGETELIGKIAEGRSIEQLAAGVNYSVFQRLKADLVSLFKGDPIIFVGGTAKNKAIVHFIEKEFKKKVIIPKYPQLNGAIGCTV